MHAGKLTALIFATSLLGACDAADGDADTDGQTDGQTSGETSRGETGSGPSGSGNSMSSSGATGDPSTSDPSTSGSATTDEATSDPTDADASSSSGEPPPPVSDPREPGDEEVVTSTFAFVAADGTSIPLTLYTPAGAGPYPTIGFHHGFQLGPANYVSYGQHLASWGYVVIMPQMPGSLFSPTDHVQLRAYMIEIFDWAAGGGNIAGGPLDGKADPELVGIAGHSLGGKISFLTATTDPRIDAVFGIDPVDTPGGPGAQPSEQNPSVTPELMPLVVAPVGIVGETVNATGGLGGACAPADDNFHQYFINTTSSAVEIEFLTANHMSFLDDVNCGVSCSACPAGSDDPATTRRMTHGYMVAFFELQLRGIEGFRDHLVGPLTQPDLDAGLVAIESSNGF